MNTMKAGEALQKLIQGNKVYVDARKNHADISQERREDTANRLQDPYAIIMTCSDSRVPCEHIFSAGIGELFVIRTGGNVVGDFETGSIDFCLTSFGTKLIVMMGHTGCGAVSAAMGDGQFEGGIGSIVDEIRPGIKHACDVADAENLNIENSYKRILESKIVQDLLASGEIEVVKAKYNMGTGVVDFIPTK